jgi:uncharacterized small protein (DUF1192 family)
MRRALPLILISSTLAIAGCQSREAKVTDLQSEYDRLAAQFHKDCNAEISDAAMNPISHPKISQKCTDEDNQLTAMANRLKAERAKQ